MLLVRHGWDIHALSLERADAESRDHRSRKRTENTKASGVQATRRRLLTVNSGALLLAMPEWLKRTLRTHVTPVAWI
jgi:hypothetical protein